MLNQAIESRGHTLRRIVIIGTALAVLVGAGAAYASFNSYSGSALTFSSHGAGSPAHPESVGMTERLVANAPSGERAAPLTNIKLTIYGVKLDAGKLPVCSDALIANNKTNPNGGCPAGSVIGTGLVHSELGPGTSSSSSAGTACNPSLHVFNGGPSRQVFYFSTEHATDCGGLTTGSTAPWDGHISYSGGNAVINIPLPPAISTEAANHPGLYASLITQTVSFAKAVDGKPYMVSVGSKHGTRPWSITFTAHNYDGSSETQTISGAASA
jgi:hypothetical protein